MKERILVIDDSRSILDFLNIILEKEGYTVHISLCAYDNAVMVAQLQPDLIVLDFHLGRGQNGGQQIQLLKLYPPTASIPILLCTADHSEISAYEYFFQEYRIPVIFKPFHLKELLQAIRRSLYPDLKASFVSQ
jgi:CheY-like chemotaxis protein